jgi:nucleoside-diphosphate-sugar epimerase
MKVLIIGNLGYVGPVLTEYLSKNKHYQLWGFDIGYFLGNELYKNYLLPEAYLNCQYFGDVRVLNPALFEGMDAVVYLAAISNDPMGNVFEQPTYDINQHAAVRIATMAREKKVRKFVFASSCSVYGSADDKPRTEESELNPLTAYAKSKINAEKELLPLAGENFQITCLRFATACGMSARLRLDLVLNDFITSAYLHKKIEILSNGTPWRPLIHVHDMSRAIEWALIRDASSGDYLVCNCGSDEWNYQVLELAKAVKEYLPDTEISVNHQAPPDKRSYKVDFSKFKKLSGNYYPVYTLDKTIQEFVEALKKHHFSIPDFRQSHFIRLNTLNELIKNGQINHKLEKI